MSAGGNDDAAPRPAFVDEFRPYLRRVLLAIRSGDLSAAVAAADDLDRWLEAADADALTKSRVLFQIGDNLNDAGLHVEARSRYARSVDLTSGLCGQQAAFGTGLCLARIATIDRDAGDLDRATEALNTALACFEQAADRLAMGQTSNNLGVVRHRAGDIDEAEQRYRDALTVAESVDDLELRASALGNLGKVALDRFRLPDAERLLGQAIMATRELGAAGLLMSQVGDLGNVLRITGQSDQALRCYDEALQLAEVLGDQRGQHLSLGNLGAIYGERGEISRALMLLERSHAISRALGDPSATVTDLLHLSGLHRRLHQPERAEQCLQEAWALIPQVGPDLLRVVEDRLGRLALDRGNLEQAEQHFARVLASEQAQGDTYNIGTSWLNLGHIAWQREDVEQAQARWLQALAAHETAGNPTGQSTAHLDLAAAYVEQGDLEVAGTHLDAAIQIAEKLPLPDDARVGWVSMSLLRRRRGDRAGARDACEHAISWAERSRGAVLDTSQRIAVWSDLEAPYLDLIHLAMLDSDRLTAWRTVQRARARAQSEQLGEGRLAQPATVPADLRDRERELLDQRRQIVQAARGELSAEQIGRLFALAEDVDHVWRAMTDVAPEYVALRRGEPISHAAVRACLRVDAAESTPSSELTTPVTTHGDPP